MAQVPIVFRRLCHRLAFLSCRRLSFESPRRSHVHIWKSIPENRYYPSSSFATSAAAPSEAQSSSIDGGNSDLIISDRAVQRLKQIAKSGECLRVLVDSGGCSGFEYKFELVSKPESDDRIFEKDGTRVIVDELSLDFLRGATIDYQVELIKAAFRVVQNPRAEKGCSCGASFALKPAPGSVSGKKS